MKLTGLAGRILVLVALLLSLSPSFGIFFYGDYNGINVAYQQVTEDSTTDPGLPLYGAPSVAGNSLIFSPVSFGITTANGSFDFMDGTVTTRIVGLGNSGIDMLQFGERGDYTLAGGGTTATSASVSSSLFVRITHVNGSALLSPIVANANMVYTPSGGTYNLIADPGLAVIWQGSVLFDLNAILAANSVSGKATQVLFSMDNALLAFSEQGTIAYIKKKGIEGVSITAIVPEPSSIGLLALGALGLIASRRSR